jgi:hypothetical protein
MQVLRAGIVHLQGLLLPQLNQAYFEKVVLLVNNNEDNSKLVNFRWREFTIHKTWKKKREKEQNNNTKSKVTIYIHIYKYN